MKSNFEKETYLYEEDGVIYKGTPEEVFRLATIRTIEWKVEIANPGIEHLANILIKQKSLNERLLNKAAEADRRIKWLEEQIKTLTAKNAADSDAVPETV